jgi:hypothetical protein
VKTQVFVLVPYDVSPEDIGDYVQLLLESHRFVPGESTGRYDYLVGPLGTSLKDPVAEGRLPPKIRRSYAGNICERANLPADAVPGALVTPDGKWHDLKDFGWQLIQDPSDENTAARGQWRERYHELIAGHLECWVVEIYAHS